MLREDFAAAWSIADTVLTERHAPSRDDPTRPYHERWVWDGTDLAGRRVTVRCYHGLGDTLQFARFLPALRARASHVTLEAQPELLPLLADWPGVDSLLGFDPASPVPAEHSIEIMELQHALRAEPGGSPYLNVPPTPVLNARTGACWKAGGWDPSRSIPLGLLQPVLPPATISLQRGAAGLPDPLDGDMDIRTMAGLIASLERVVTVDTMIAHLAGALGRPVHLLLKADADWRWGTGPRTAWYASVRIHRQRCPGNWTSALQSLSAALKAGD